MLTYNSGFKCFKRFASMYQLYDHTLGLPNINEDILIYFLAYCYHSLHLKYSTIKLYLAGIRFVYIRSGFDNPLTALNGAPFPRIQMLLKSIKKLQGLPKRPRLPVTFDILENMVDLLRTGMFGPFTDVMLEAACTLAFFGFLRCGEFTKSKKSKSFLTFGDIKFNEQNQSFKVILKTSKTDPFRQGVTITIFKVNHSICPYRAMHRYCNIMKRYGRQASQSLFLTSNNKTLTRTFFVDKIRQILRRLDLNEMHYSGHSFRGGAATSASKARIEDHLIRTLGRWSSDCYIRYIDTPISVIKAAQQSLAFTGNLKQKY